MAKKSLLRSAQNARAKAPLYDKRQANRISLRVIAAVAVLLGAYIALELSTDPARVSGGELRVRALFGFRVPLSEIAELSLERSPISVGRRSLGNDAFGLFREGDYEVGSLGKARVFLKKPNVSYIIVRTSDRDYAISLGSVDKDQALYDEIKLGMPSGK
jgi:hypothetical protein